MSTHGIRSGRGALVLPEADVGNCKILITDPWPQIVTVYSIFHQKLETRTNYNVYFIS